MQRLYYHFPGTCLGLHALWARRHVYLFHQRHLQARLLWEPLAGTPR